MSIHQQLTSAHVPQIKVTRNQSNRPQRPFASSTYRPQLQPPISLRPTAPVRRNSANAAMLGARRASVVSPAPPMSPSSIPRPHSSTGHHSHARMPSDAASQRGSPDPESRNVRVVLRVRPSDPDDASVPPRFRNVLVNPISASDVRVDVDPATLAGHGASSVAPSGSKRHPAFSFDHVLGESSTQVDLYEATAIESVDEFINGHNVTFLAYGQTSSGKSYSMGTTGDDSDYSDIEPNSRTGLIPRTVRTIFERAEELRLASGAGASWECRLSFLELYNEEMIDLLSGSGISISIREERDGRIVWAGVREVRVKSLAEVMQYLYEGSARRKTGETGMNAQSSRSHAIFSLTLVQKRRVGSGHSDFAPAQSASGDATPTRSLKRPSSTTGISGLRSPTPSGSRPSAPPSSFSKAGSSLPRPNSIVGPPLDGEFLVVTSKFNMVDLAGSERLKRTAAQGDRMKEGISINSGLLALGNVISTLADPMKARGHIPYRDSKLTRMLQDSIGGNSLTTMIACVSPIEYNIGETMNTIKYASRARNIKNQSKINAVEAGWDDVEHLQNTILKLRKQMASTGEGGLKAARDRDDGVGSEKLLQRLAELQREHTELYDRYLAKCSENMRLTSELRNAKPGDGDALAKFNETVEPVILEYEKVVAALNRQLDELRLELTALSDLYEEQNKQLADAREKQAQSEIYVTELRGRLVKLTERNTSSEAYIQDLETKLKSHADKEETHRDVVADLRKEMAKLRESNERLTLHTTEIEARLAKSETHSTGLLAQIEKHEQMAVQRETAYRELERHIAILDTSKDIKLLLAEIETKDRRIADLDRELQEKDEGLTEERAQLLGTVEFEKAQTAELRAKLSSLELSTSSMASVRKQASNMSLDDAKEVISSRSPVMPVRELTPPDSPESQQPATSAHEDQIVQLEAALKELSARCADAEMRYTDAESQIAELNSQLSEAKLIRDEMADILPVSPVPASPANTDDVSDAGTMLQTPRGMSPNTSPLRMGSRRGSVPALVVDTKARDFRGGRGPGETRRARPLSLSQELSSAQSSLVSPRTSWAGPPSTLRLANSPNRQSLPATPNTPRSSQSLEAELKFVHGVVEKRDAELKDREAYISQLEQTLRTSHMTPSRQTSASPLVTPGEAPVAANIPLPLSPTVPRLEVEDEDADLKTSEPIRKMDLSPSSSQRFTALKESLAAVQKDGSVDEGSQACVDDLLKEMEMKETSHRAIIEQQFVQIADLQKANNKLRGELYELEPATTFALDGLKAERRESAINGSISGLSSPFPSPRSDAAANKRREEHSKELQSLITSHEETVDSLRQEHSAAVEEVRQALAKARTDYQNNLVEYRATHSKAIADLGVNHESAMAGLQKDHEGLVAGLKKGHDNTIAHLRRTHEEGMASLQKDHDLLVEEMEKSLSSSEEQRRQLKMKADQTMFELSRVRDEAAMIRNGNSKQVGDLQRANEHFEKINVELESVNTDLNRRLSELDQKYPRKSSMTVTSMPPQGPPPNTPLPPLPGQVASPIAKVPSSEGTWSSSTHRSTISSGSTAPTSISDMGAAMAQAHLPEPVGSMVQKVVAERDAALLEKEELRRQLEADLGKARAAERKLEEELRKAEDLSRDLQDSKKTNSKLRAHLEDARQESKRLTEACREHMDELNDRRSTMNELSKESGQNRDSLVAANAQVAHLRAQLDRAVQQKVDKKLNNRLKCF